MRPLKTAFYVGPQTRWPSFPHSGLGLPTIPAAPVSSSGASSVDPWWFRLSMPFAEAGASRLAHGVTPSFGFDYRQSYSGPMGPLGGLPGAAQWSSYLPLIILGAGVLLLMRRT